MKAAALLVVVLASVSAAGCASPCVDDRCSAKKPAHLVARNEQASAEPAPPPPDQSALTAESPPAAPAEPLPAAVAEPATQPGVIYTDGQLTIRYEVQPNPSDPSLADIAFTYVNRSPGVAAVQFTVQGRDAGGKDLWTRRLGSDRLNAATSAVGTVTTAVSSFPLAISVADVKLCPIRAGDPASAPACAQVAPEQGGTARLERPAQTP